MGKPALFVDVDGTLAFQPEGDILAVNARYGTSWLVADATWTPFSAGIPREQAAWLDENRAVITANLAPDTRAIAVLRRAAKVGLKITIATERGPALEDLTAAWLKFWQVPYDALAVVGPGNKGPLLAPYGPGNPCVLIDDSPANVDLARPGVDVWQPARPYNSGGDGVHRFEDWRDVKKALGLKR